MASAVLESVPLDVAKIKQLREARGWTMEEAAKRAGFKSRQAWYNIEAGRQSPSLATLDRIAKALGVRPGELLK